MADLKIYSVAYDTTKFISYDSAHSRAKLLANKLKIDISIFEKDSNSSPWVVVGEVECEKPEHIREIPLWLVIGILLLPPIFIWFLLRRGYTVWQRLFAITPLITLIYIVINEGSKNITHPENTVIEKCHDINHADSFGLSVAQIYVNNARLLNKEGLDAVTVALEGCKKEFQVDNQCIERCLLSFKVEMKNYLKNNKSFK